MDAEDLRALGVAPDEIARLERMMQPAQTLEAFVPWPDNVQSIEVFKAMSSQWNVGGMGGVIGLRYEALPVVLDLLAVKRGDRRGVFEGLRIMEREAVESMNDRPAKA